MARHKIGSGTSPLRPGTQSVGHPGAIRVLAVNRPALGGQAGSHAVTVTLRHRGTFTRSHKYSSIHMFFQIHMGALYRHRLIGSVLQNYSSLHFSCVILSMLLLLSYDTWTCLGGWRELCLILSLFTRVWHHNPLAYSGPQTNLPACSSELGRASHILVYARVNNHVLSIWFPLLNHDFWGRKGNMAANCNWPDYSSELI